MLRSSPTNKGNGIVRSRVSTPAGASRSNDKKKEEFGFVHEGDYKLNTNYTSPSHADASSSRKLWTESPSSDDKLANEYYRKALHEDSRDEKKAEDGDFGSPYVVSNVGPNPYASSIRTVPGRATKQWRRRKRNSRNAAWSILNLFQGSTVAKSTWHPLTSKKTRSSSSNLPTLVLAVALWYSLGVISISTSKLLLVGPSASLQELGGAEYYAHVGGVGPTLLTLQQLLLGSTFLRFLLSIQCLQSSGVQPLEYLLGDFSTTSRSSSSKSLLQRGEYVNQEYGSILELYWRLLQHPHTKYLCLAGFCFSLGFYCTNCGFQAASAAFVETIKASEPITSAILAVAWGLEILNRKEVTSLALIVCGVVLSTLGNHAAPSTSDVDSSSGDGSEPDGGLGMAAATSLLSCMIVMTSNLCFSFRGLFQKLFQANKGSQSIHMNDLNLQYRMQQMGVLVFLIPTIIWDGRSVVGHIYQVSSHVGLIQSGVLIRYIGLAIANAMAFASYNLASTFLLSRISVVHHAALNCIRRIFAIVVTSILFANPISATGMLGILISFGGFMSFTHAKQQKKRHSKAELLPVSKSQS